MLPISQGGSVLRKSFPLLLTSFVNKCGAIGLSLLPMLLIERKINVATSSWFMAIVKTAMLGGVFLGGWISDQLGLKRTILLSFFLTSVGLAVLTFSKPMGLDLAWICLFAVFAQVGQAMFSGPGRFLIAELVAPEQQKEAIGWLRSSNNLGQIISYSIGSLFSHAGLLVLMGFDSATSLLAGLLGIFLLPGSLRSVKTAAEKPAPTRAHKRSNWRLFFLLTLLLGGYDCLYDLFLTGCAARFKLMFGNEGLAIYSKGFVINTLLCTFLGVYAARFFKNPNRAFPIGIILGGLGTALACSGTQSLPLIYLGAFAFSLGEIFFFSMAQFVLLLAMPEVKRPGAMYSLGLVIQTLGRILGASLAFPFVVYAINPAPFILSVMAAVFFIWILARSGLKQLTSVD